MLEETINNLAKRKIARILSELSNGHEISDSTKQFIKSEIYGYKNDILMYVNVMNESKQNEETNYNR